MGLPENNIQIIPMDGKNPSEDNIKDIEKGISWLKEWIDNRHKNGFINDSDYNKAKDKLDNIIVVTKQGEFPDVPDANGYYVLAPKGLKKTINNVDVPLSYAIFIRTDIKDITSTVIHESTHQMCLDTSEIKCYTENTKDKYWDSPREIYARLMQTRYSLGLNADKSFSKEEIAVLRAVEQQSLSGMDFKQWKKHQAAKYKNEKAEYEQSIDGLDECFLDFFEKPQEPFIPSKKEMKKLVSPKEDINSHHIFNRYSDEEIQEFLNTTAYHDNTKEKTTNSMNNDIDMQSFSQTMQNNHARITALRKKLAHRDSTPPDTPIEETQPIHKRNISFNPAYFIQLSKKQYA